ncbi:DUF1217 domain-containing protein [Pseudoroseicyclus aestuarii]|uniref:Uncharacterized protein DUF1217 n=1 Tax=Pseudoroseicyclus aestuarii TaxID=1795041 RepID=A0A318T2E1_9RHOB|nr:DUF1217 domain-containing protein [Pseudoroseicyclus aestuarii]PYE84384.1 uncharacterized protein DUF1217 [Pseudoroseicyclus aestuarii]
MIPIAGMGASVGLTLSTATRERQMALIETGAMQSREIEAFRSRIDDIQTVDQLIADPEVYRFVMKAHDLEDQIFGKAMIRKILQSDDSEPGALINRMTDPRFEALYDGLGFTEGGTVNENTKDPAWIEGLVDRYVEQAFINDAAAQNEAVGQALTFRRDAASVRSWYDVLGNPALSRVLRGALGIPEAVAGIDLDRQVEMFAGKMDLSDLKDPREVESILRRYTALTDAKSGAAAASSAAVQLMAGAQASASGNWTPRLLDISAIDVSVLSGASAYRR